MLNHHLHNLALYHTLVGKAYHQWEDVGNRTHHQVSLSSPQTEDGSSMSPHATSPQMQNTACGQSSCNWYPAVTKDWWLSVHHTTTVLP